MHERAAVAALAFSLTGVVAVFAQSLRVTPAEAYVGSFSPAAGQGVGTRLLLENPGAKALAVGLSVALPPPGDLRDGYEPWPRPDLVRVLPKRVRLAPGEAFRAGVETELPAGLTSTGGQYQFDVRETATDFSGASLQTRTSVLLSLGPRLAEAGDIPASGRARRPEFSLAPTSAALEKIPLGRSSGRAMAVVKIVNAGEKSLTVTLRPAQSWDKEEVHLGGRVPAPNPRWLAVKPGSLAVPAGKIATAVVSVSVPDEARYAEKSWAFVVAVDAADGGKTTRRYFLLDVTTAGKEAVR